MFDIYEAMTSPRGFLPFFKNGLESWASWLVFFKVLAGRTDLSADEREILSISTGLDELPAERLKEIFLCCGRRSGKSTACSLMAVYYGLWGGWDKDLQAGEKPQIFIISPTLIQGKIIMGYVKAVLSMKHLKGFVRREQQESVELTNGTVITIKPASWRSTRGWSVGLILMEELAFWRFETESANVDTEIYTALKPSTANIKNSLVVGISTPFIRQGLLWTKSANWGKPGPVMFWRAPTWAMNRLLDEDELRKEYDTLSEAEFNSEFGAEEREDIEQFLPQELIDQAIVPGRSVLLADSSLSYVGFCDASEGLRKGADSMTFAIAHAARERFIVDTLLEFKPPFAPKVVIQTIAESCKAYRVSTITQDRHAISWIADDFKAYDIAIETSALTKSEIYAQFAILASKGVVELPDNDRLRIQLQGLQKFLGGSGTIKIDHLQNGHDDIANAGCGACVLAARAGAEGYAGFSKESFY